MVEKKEKPVVKSAEAKEKEQNGGGEGFISEAEKASPVLTAVGKRLRAARKRLNKIESIETKKAAGEEINDQQAETLKGKPGTLAIIDELSKLGDLLKPAIAEEVEGATSKAVTSAVAEAIPAALADSQAQAEADKQAAVAQVSEAAAAEAAQAARSMEALQAELDAERSKPVPEPAPSREAIVEEAVGRFLQIIYFSQVFDGSVALAQQMEKNACLTYDYTCSIEGPQLTPSDLDMICKFGRSVTSRPSGKTISHKEALENCKQLALKWINFHETGEDSEVPELGYTMSQLSERLTRVLASDYFTIEPTITTVTEEVAAKAAAAAAAAVVNAGGAGPGSAAQMQQAYYQQQQQQQQQQSRMAGMEQGLGEGPASAVGGEAPLISEQQHPSQHEQGLDHLAGMGVPPQPLAQPPPSAAQHHSGAGADRSYYPPFTHQPPYFPPTMQQPGPPAQQQLPNGHAYGLQDGMPAFNFISDSNISMDGVSESSGGLQELPSAPAAPAASEAPHFGMPINQQLREREQRGRGPPRGGRGPGRGRGGDFIPRGPPPPGGRGGRGPLPLADFRGAGGPPPAFGAPQPELLQAQQQHVQRGGGGEFIPRGGRGVRLPAQRGGGGRGMRGGPGPQPQPNMMPVGNGGMGMGV